MLFSTANAEEEINIWDKKDTKEIIDKPKNSIDTTLNQLPKLEKVETTKTNQIEIEKDLSESQDQVKIFGIFDPSENDFDLNMWSRTDSENVRSSLKRIDKIKLSSTATKLFENTLFSFAYPPNGMNEKEFIDFKIDWLIKNKKTTLIEKFLKQNETFHNKKKIVQHLVDENIAEANLKEGCKKINFLDKNIKDSYLEKFKIYCLIFNGRKNEAQLQYDILKEQNQSDKFFDDKINYLLGIKDSTNKKIKDDNLLNFYLASITTSNFKYEPNKKTKKIIWEYLNAANLIKLDDIEDKEKLKNLEIAANNDQFRKKSIFDIYKRIPFDLNTLINAENVYQTLSGSDGRALIYQKYLLSDNNEKKVELLFILKDLFKKDSLSNIYVKFLSDNLLEIGLENIPENYLEVVNQNIINEKEYKLGKIKYDDKILHRSKVLKFYTEETENKKIQKDLNKIYKKIKKNRKYFFSAKDLALIDSLASDGFEIPNDLKYKDLYDKYPVPSNLLELAKNKETAFLTLKIVEIIGEDEPNQLDPETIFFITHLLNQTNLKKLRNEVLISALPQRN